VGICAQQTRFPGGFFSELPAQLTVDSTKFRQSGRKRRRRYIESTRSHSLGLTDAATACITSGLESVMLPGKSDCTQRNQCSRRDVAKSNQNCSDSTTGSASVNHSQAIGVMTNQSSCRPITAVHAQGYLEARYLLLRQWVPGQLPATRSCCYNQRRYCIDVSGNGFGLTSGRQTAFGCEQQPALGR